MGQFAGIQGQRFFRICHRLEHVAELGTLVQLLQPIGQAIGIGFSFQQVLVHQVQQVGGRARCQGGVVKQELGRAEQVLCQAVGAQDADIQLFDPIP